MNTAAETLLAFWENPRNIPFKGSLISEESPNEGEPLTTCMCAQGQALHIVGGYSEEDLRNLGQREADKEVARLLQVSVAHSVLLRRINDGQPGAPSDVLTNPEKYLGKNHQAVLDFWTLIDSLTEDNWGEVSHRYNAAASDAAAEAAARASYVTPGLAAWYAACDAAGYAASDAARSAAGSAGFAAGWATCELMGSHILLEQGKSLFFVPIFENLK